MPLLILPTRRSIASLRLLPLLGLAAGLMSACATSSGPAGTGGWRQDAAPAEPPAILDDVRVSELRGSATIQGDGRTIALKPDTRIEENRPVQVGAKSSLKLELGTRAVFELGPNSRFVVHQLPRDGSAVERQTGLRLEKGYLRILASDDPGAAPIELSFARWAAKLGPGEYFFDARADTASACSARGALDLAGVPEWTPQTVESSCVNLAPRRDPVLVSLRDKDWQTLRAQRRLQPTLARAASRPAPRTQTAALEPGTTPRAERAVARSGQTLAYLPATPVVSRIASPEYAAPAPAPAVVLFADPPEEELSADDVASEPAAAANDEEASGVIERGDVEREPPHVAVPNSAEASPANVETAAPATVSPSIEVAQTPAPAAFTPSLEIIERVPPSPAEEATAIQAASPSQAPMVDGGSTAAAEPVVVTTTVAEQPVAAVEVAESSAIVTAPPAMTPPAPEVAASAATAEASSSPVVALAQPAVTDAMPASASTVAVIPSEPSPSATANPAPRHDPAATDVVAHAPAASPVESAPAAAPVESATTASAPTVAAPVEVATYIPSDAGAPGAIGSDMQGAMIAPSEPLPAEWIVNVASYPMIEAAQEHAQTLIAQNYKAGVRHETVRGRSSYRVVIEGLPTEVAAQSAARELQSRYGIRAAWVLRKR